MQQNRNESEDLIVGVKNTLDDENPPDQPCARMTAARGGREIAIDWS